MLDAEYNTKSQQYNNTALSFLWISADPTIPFNGHWVSAIWALSGPMDNGIPWHGAVYFSQWSNGRKKGGQNLDKMWLRRDTDPYAKKGC